MLGFPGSSAGKESACNVGDLGLIPGWEDPLEKGMATHSSILAWRIPWTLGLQELDTIEQFSLSYLLISESKSICSINLHMVIF